MTVSTHENSERLTRQHAAERLTDIAYALMTGGPLKLGPDVQVTGPVADEVMLKRVSKSDDDRVQLALELSWSTTQSLT